MRKTTKTPVTRRRHISVESLMAKAGIDRSTALRVMKTLDDFNLAEFVKGVKGYPSRLEMI